MSTVTLQRLARRLEQAVIVLALGALAFRATLYGSLPPDAGARYGTGDIIDYGLGLVLFLLCGACAALGVVLTTRVAADAQARAYRPVLIGMTTFVVYYFVHPYVPTLASTSVP